jgi:hypothetical protein
MKMLKSLPLLLGFLLLAGCATQESGSVTAESEATALASDSSSMNEGMSEGMSTGMGDGKGEKTAYDGATGSGLLMERYKSGRIEGLQR